MMMAAAPTPGNNPPEVLDKLAKLTLEDEAVKEQALREKMVRDAKNEDKAFSDEDSKTKIFVGGLSWDTDEGSFRKYFERYGSIKDCAIIRHPGTAKSRGFGFVTFETAEAREMALEKRDHLIDGRLAEAKTVADAKNGMISIKKIFVGGITSDTTDTDLKQYFNKFGNIREARVMKERNSNRPRGFGFVTFEEEEAVDKVCAIHMHTVRDKKVEVKRAEPRKAMPPPRRSPPATAQYPQLPFGTTLPMYSMAGPSEQSLSAYGYSAFPSRQSRPGVDPTQQLYLPGALASTTALPSQMYPRQSQAVAAASYPDTGYASQAALSYYGIHPSMPMPPPSTVSPQYSQYMSARGYPSAHAQYVSYTMGQNPFYDSPPRSSTAGDTNPSLVQY
eukprot:GCRY01001448.1.p1 GENE.GCRY01001448.1~~GCRY01001448.1.p1  ORF type:complete len:390 (+),score=117.21 GCRY01001448.1:325-1494(+)